VNDAKKMTMNEKVSTNIKTRRSVLMADIREEKKREKRKDLSFICNWFEERYGHDILTGQDRTVMMQASR
jgi:hypothetical protein